MTSRSTKKGGRKGSNGRDSGADTLDHEYRVGPGRLPKEFQFKPGQSGNPKGAKQKPPILKELSAILERALSKKVTLRQGEKERIVTKAEAGIEQLVNGFAQGDRRARRDLMALAHALGVDLTATVRQPDGRRSRTEIIDAMQALGIPVQRFFPPQYEHDDDPAEPANGCPGIEQEPEE
jgi:hypothetical protein